ncbi:transcriptional regulator family: Fungal Specific TF [Penicillium argentinense]|uniref:Transcriptional regulator family: Fungal Specific TF n=1 Tax=Penicillium argentinense TaxID=1131581 RepID=A0A9W9EW19_9EURO|nr:transcriptional regulator family: Fungal Specific TF [Penicillium argentinense]KAJ5088930.1 transcriptional regulator family: Fungal Specific TF [Penicillium argentinense]
MSPMQIGKEEGKLSSDEGLRAQCDYRTSEAKDIEKSADRDWLPMKCSGPPAPCKASLSAVAENDCQFDPSRDLRRKVAVKRTIRRLVSDDGDQHMEQSFAEKLETKSIGPSELHLISSSTEEEQHIESSRAAFHPYARVILESLCDIPLFNVPAKPWTDVTDDRELVYCDSHGVFSDPENMFSRGNDFFKEAERLWVAQEGRPTLPNIQALLLMSNVVSRQGNTAQGWFMLRQAVHLGEELSLFELPRGAAHLDPGGKIIFSGMERVRALAAWAVFTLNLQMVMKLRKGANLAPPVTYITKPAHLPQVRKGLADLTNIMMQVQRLFYDDRFIGKFEALLRKRKTCIKVFKDGWQIGRTDRRSGKNRSHSSSFSGKGAINCLQAIMSLCEMLTKRDQHGTMGPQLRQTCSQQAEEMSHCLRIRRQSYGLKHMPSQVVDAVLTTIRALVYRLESDDAKRVFTELCRFGIALSQRFNPIADTIHGMQTLAQRGVVNLPPPGQRSS